MISLILLKLFTFSQILQGVPKLLHATVYIYTVYIHCRAKAKDRNYFLLFTVGTESIQTPLNFSLCYIAAIC